MKITRDAFLFMTGDVADFAQCSACRDFAKDRKRCAILGPKFEVAGGDSCGLFVEGTYPAGYPVRKLVTPDEAGFVRRKVRCENCKFGGSKCALYVMLNKKFPAVFDLEEAIDPRDCCNANTPKRAA